MRQSSKTALGGIVAALSVAIMLATAIIPFLTYAMPAIAGAGLIVMVIEINKKWALAAFTATALLSFLVLTDKEAAIMYAAFFGYYPILKSTLESKLSRISEYIVKFLIFNAAVTGATLFAFYVFKIPMDFIDDYGTKLIPVFLAMANLTFIGYDFVLTNIIEIYMKRLRKKFKQIFR